jgi:hypothetical protein
VTQQADKQMTVRGKGRPGDIQEKAAEILMSSFRVCVTDLRAAREQSKKWGTLPVINQLFKVYFKVIKEYYHHGHTNNLTSSR